MHPHHDNRAESAIYWSAVSLIVCEGLSVGAAAQRLGIENVRLRNILRRRRRRFADLSGVTNPRHSSLP
jgi:DNA-directed RNA polymerase specialized sigma24 family protein